MANEFSDYHYWAIILGGSSGLGLAAAQKLAAHGMHLCIIHRDPGVEMEKVNAAFEGLRKNDIQVITFNADVTRADKRGHILETLQHRLGATGKVRCLLHSIARGTLKAMVPDSGAGSDNRKALPPDSGIAFSSNSDNRSSLPPDSGLASSSNSDNRKNLPPDGGLASSSNSDNRNSLPSDSDLASSSNSDDRNALPLDSDLASSSNSDNRNSLPSALSTNDFRITLDSMAYSLYDWVKDVSEKNLFAADARVLSFTSEGSHRAWKHYGAVSAAKAALEAISRNIALEFAPLGIRANCIQAGTTNTRSLQLIPGSDQLMAWSKARNPFQRLTTPEDVANVVYLLCKDEAAWINGATIPVDGGAHIC